MIHHSMLVSDINREFPQCRPVFEKYGIAGCGGADGPPEPLFIFAAAHRVALPELVNELNQALRGEWREEAKLSAGDVAVEEAKAEQLYKRFIAAALLVALTVGFTLGAINLTRIAVARSYSDISGVLKQIHGHAQIFGWVGLFIMGVAFHAVPRFKMVGLPSLRAANACLALLVAGIVVRTFAQPFGWRWLLLASGLMELASVGIFVGLLALIARQSKQSREFYEKFIAASVAWFAVLAVWNMMAVAQMFARRSTGIPPVLDAWMIQVGLFGFISNMIFAFALRVLPHFLGLRATKIWAANAAFWLWNAAILCRYPVAWQRDRLDLVASWLELIAALLFVWAVGIFAKRRTKIEIAGVDNTFAWFIYLGFGWLVLNVLQPFHADLPRLTASARHGMAVGFIMSIILGVAYRILPIFNGVNLHSPWAMRLSFWLHAAGTSLILAMAYSARREQPWMFNWAAASGWCVAAASALFAWNLWLTLRTKAEKFTKDSVAKLNTRVTELLEVYPDLRPVLIHGGLGGLASMRHNPPRFVTLEFAARRHGIDPAPLLKLLNEEIQRRKP
ncbi:MAG: hypothetical protein PCFJNLEI_02154 [Verrucomicrobiae bacterium]|nr:hypothetical protein [Verrucomicrobiae bacterium]